MYIVWLSAMPGVDTVVIWWEAGAPDSPAAIIKHRGNSYPCIDRELCSCLKSLLKHTSLLPFYTSRKPFALLKKQVEEMPEYRGIDIEAQSGRYIILLSILMPSAKQTSSSTPDRCKHPKCLHSFLKAICDINKERNGNSGCCVGGTGDEVNIPTASVKPSDESRLSEDLLQDQRVMFYVLVQSQDSCAMVAVCCIVFLAVMMLLSVPGRTA